MKGIKGEEIEDKEKVGEEVRNIKKRKEMKICVGLGVKKKEKDEEIEKNEDGVVVGKEIVKEIEGEIDEKGKEKGDKVEEEKRIVKDIEESVREKRIEEEK